MDNLTPGTPYHFKVASTNNYAISSSSGDQTFETQNPLLTLVITSPPNGAIINRSAVMASGTVVNAKGNETGVMVNGKAAMLIGNEFAVNHIPLEEGENILQAIATDTEGNAVTTSARVNAVKTEDYIKIQTNPESGLSPLEILLTIESSLDLKNASLTYNGPGDAESLCTFWNECSVKLSVEGLYSFTVSLNSNATLYQDTVAIAVFSEAEFDALLRGKWEAMRSSLSSGDIEGALVVFDERSKETYRELFNALSSMLSTIVQEMSDIKLIKQTRNSAIYDVRTVRDGIDYSFQLLFTTDSNGIWKISSF